MSEWKNQERGEKERKRRYLVVDFENVKCLQISSASYLKHGSGFSKSGGEHQVVNF